MAAAKKSRSPKRESKLDPITSQIDKAITQLRKTAAPDTLPLLENFTRQYYRSVSAEDLLERTPANLAGAAATHWQFAQKRIPGTPNIRVYNPGKTDGWHSTHTIVEMVTEDMPFLVDSMAMVLNKHGYSIHLTVHPIIGVSRDKRGKLTGLADNGEGASESFMHVEFDRETDAEKLALLESDIARAIRDVRATVTDWQAMRAKAAEIRDSLAGRKLPLPKDEVHEGAAFMDWLLSNHFTFLGYREYDLVREKGEDILKVVAGSGLGILRDKSSQNASKSFLVLPKDIRGQARARELLIITKANSIATVHRPGYMDYIGIKRFNAKGEVIGEQRFLGLFTSEAYSHTPRTIPLLRHKFEQVLQRSLLPRNSHGGKALTHILDTFPRDELFQSSSDELFEFAIGVLQLQERQRIKLFVRRDTFGRFFSCLVYVPRDRFNTQVRQRIQDLLHETLGGVRSESQAFLSESALARIHVIVRTTPWQFKKYAIDELEKEITAIVRSWQDELKDIALERFGEEHGRILIESYGDYFPAAYREDVKPKAAVFDLEQMEALTDDDVLRMSLYRPQHNPKNLLRFKIFRREQPIPISDALPMLENMGLKVISERPYEIDLADGGIVWIQDFEMIYSQGERLDPATVRIIFQDTFERVWTGALENDGFNKLVLAAQFTWRQVMLIRAYCKYLVQTTGIPFSQSYMENALVNNADIARQLVTLFETKFEPRANKQRDTQIETLTQDIRAALENVASLDDDRILRGYLHVMSATLRTNFFQADAQDNPKPYVSFKFDPSRIPELPLPKPAFEIFVYSPRVEGVHLRGGKVARGGLRWSDRREDFRTEVLGLMKAQQVKNAVIVPVGAKGGFYVKRPPTGGDREAMLKEGIACYKMFISGMLDITDNLKSNKLIPPANVVRHDEDDPYLVVAADKGTATFSDIANGVAREYGFWLDDAFASGGSAGYDHKGMGITAKGGWESVKRHFRELGVDCQTTNFSAVGIGDMSGDVFGNGMLLSRHIKLKAAFDHRHIFIDPFPDPETSFQERERLFNLPRSSWADYNLELISKGGGVYSRSAKSIKLSTEAREVLGVDEAALTPQQLMKAILKAPVDLLWNGGIGTYVKSAQETNTDVGDRSNDAIRVNGKELRCRIVGEGGNLGCTQLGRIEFALQGGHINTDFIDNSAGVDCSDHEVNIKILLNLVDKKQLPEKQRNKLLAAMTDEVGRLVLRNNYMQAQALSIISAQAPQRLSEHAYLIRQLERTGKLNRALEFLPTDEEILARRAAGKGMTRPELATLLAYSKLDIYRHLIESDVPEDSYLALELENYFPQPLQKRYQAFMPKHRLQREIVATAITNSMTNRMGATFAIRTQDETGKTAADVARAYTISREVFGMRNIWAAIEALDNVIPASVQVAMMVQTGRLLRHATRWLLNRPGQSLDIADSVATYAPGISELLEHLQDVMDPVEATRYGESMQQYMDLGVPEQLAHTIAAIKTMYAALDIVAVTLERKLPVRIVASAYFHLDCRLELNWVREQIENLVVDGHWQAIARGTLRDNLYARHRQLSNLALQGVGKNTDGKGIVNAWLDKREQRVQHTQRVIGDMRTAGNLDFATASVALQEIGKLA